MQKMFRLMSAWSFTTAYNCNMYKSLAIWLLRRVDSARANSRKWHDVRKSSLMKVVISHTCFYWLWLFTRQQPHQKQQHNTKKKKLRNSTKIDYRTLKTYFSYTKIRNTYHVMFWINISLRLIIHQNVHLTLSFFYRL